MFKSLSNLLKVIAIDSIQTQSPYFKWLYYLLIFFLIGENLMTLLHNQMGAQEGGTKFHIVFVYLSTCISPSTVLSLFLAIFFPAYFLHTFNLPFILSLQVFDQCHFWGEKSVLQWRWLPDAPEAGDNPSEQGEEVGEGRTCLWQFSSELEGQGCKILWHIKWKQSLGLDIWAGEQEINILRTSEKPFLKFVSPLSCYVG